VQAGVKSRSCIICVLGLLLAIASVDAVGEGVANDTTHTIVQTKDGYPWLATESAFRAIATATFKPWQQR